MFPMSLLDAAVQLSHMMVYLRAAADSFSLWERHGVYAISEKALSRGCCHRVFCSLELL